MSAQYPVTGFEKSAAEWAAELDQTPEQMVRWIYQLREEQNELVPRQREAHETFRRLSEQADQVNCRIEALKLRLVSEL